MPALNFDGIFEATKSYDPTGFFGIETSKVDINTTAVGIPATFTQPGSAFSGNNILGTVSFGSQSFTVLASRPIKVNGKVKGFYVWLDNEAVWSGNGTQLDKAYILSLDNSYFEANKTITSSSDKIPKLLNDLLLSQPAEEINPNKDPENEDPIPEADTNGPDNDLFEDPLISPESDSGDDSDDSTADGNPILEFIDDSGNEDDVEVIGPDGDPLIEDEEYTVEETPLEDEPGKSLYTVKLVDADPDEPGDQPFGDTGNREDTGNGDNTGDGVYTLVVEDRLVSRFRIATNELSRSRRLDCLDAIYGENIGDFVDGKLTGRRFERKRGTIGNDILRGRSDSSDTLKGRKGSDLLDGVGDRISGNAFNADAPGFVQVDVLIGGAGADEFKLADLAGSYYIGRGRDDHAVIRDLNVGDRLILAGQASDYALSAISNGARELSIGGDLVAILRGRLIPGLDLTDNQQITYL